ncbi:MAG: hypothetical protein FWH03_06290 [Firmicutes bacterium]|nr:hypothetical protein [Bacillota bacterium]
MHTFFLLYNDSDSDAAKLASKLSAEIAQQKGKAFTLADGDFRENVFAADFLLYIAASDGVLSAKMYEDCWRHFDNELSWKRKLSGEIILLLKGDAARYRLPFRLRDRRIIEFADATLTAITGGIASAPKPNPAPPPIFQSVRTTQTPVVTAQPVSAQPADELDVKRTQLTQTLRRMQQGTNQPPAPPTQMSAPPPHMMPAPPPPSPPKFSSPAAPRSTSSNPYDPFAGLPRYKTPKIGQNTKKASTIVATIIAAIMLSIFIGIVVSQSNGVNCSSRTEQSIKISTAHDFNNKLRQNPNGIFEITNDIDFSKNEIDFYKYNWAPFDFNGTLDGKGFILSNFRSGDDITANAALFLTLGSNARIQNLTLSLAPPDIYLREATASVYGRVSAGGIAITNNGFIQNCTVVGGIVYARQRRVGQEVDATGAAGGIVAYNAGQIIDCSFSGTVHAERVLAGGIAGENRANGSISGSSSSGEVIAPQGTCGGIAGRNAGLIFSGGGGGDSIIIEPTRVNSRLSNLVTQNSQTTFSTAAISSMFSSSTYTGGFVGSNTSMGIIFDTYATGDVTSGGGQVGGFVGRNEGAIERSWASGNVTANNLAGGFAGGHYGGTISGCYSVGFVKAQNNAGGFAGIIRYAHITDCYSLGRVEAISFAGGFAGQINNTGTYNISHCFALGKVSDNFTSGGFFGASSAHQIINSYYVTDTTGKSGDNFGAQPLTLAEYRNPFETDGWGWEFASRDNWRITQSTGQLISAANPVAYVYDYNATNGEFLFPDGTDTRAFQHEDTPVRISYHADFDNYYYAYTLSGEKGKHFLNYSEVAFGTRGQIVPGLFYIHIT